MQDRRTGERRLQRILVFVVVAVVWGLITHGTFAGSGDEPHYLMIAHSIAFDGDLDVANDYRDATLIGDGALEPGPHVRARGERLYPVHDVGMPLLLAPIVRPAYTLAESLGDGLPEEFLTRARLNSWLLLRHQLSLVMALLTGLLAREMYLLIRALGAGQRAAFGWALLAALSPPLLSHSFLLFTEIPTALAATWVLRRLLLADVTSRAAAGLLGAVTGYLFLVHARNVGLVAGLAVAAAVLTYRGMLPRQLLGVFGLGIAAALLARTAVNLFLWDALVTTPHAALGTGLQPATIAHEVFERLTGLMWDREFGLLTYAPVYLLAAAGFRLHRTLATPLPLCMAIVGGCYLVPVLLPFTNVHGWMGGWSPAARFLVPVVPLLWLWVFVYWRHATGVGRVLAAGLIAVQLGIDGYAWQFPKTLWNDGDGISAAPFAFWLPSWNDGDAAGPFVVAAAVSGLFVYVCARHTRAARADLETVAVEADR